MPAPTFHIRPGERWLLVRPWSVVRAQLRAFVRGLGRADRLITYTATQGIPIPVRVRYLRIEEEHGLVLYENPGLNASDRRLIERLRRGLTPEPEDIQKTR